MCARWCVVIRREMATYRLIHHVNPTMSMMNPAMKFRSRGHGVRRKPGEMNRLEQAYSEHLEARRVAGEIYAWDFECIKLRLAPKTFFTPDFLVQLPDDSLEIHETKGFARDDAMVKIKVAARLFPFRFVMVKKKNKKTPWEFIPIGDALLIEDEHDQNV